MHRSHWSSSHRLLPLRGAWSGEELRATESEARPLPLPRRAWSRPFIPHYESTGSSTEIWKKGLNQSGPLVFSPALCKGKRCKTGSWSLHVFIIHLFILIHSSFACGGVRTSCGPGLRSYRPGESYTLLFILREGLARSQHLGPVQDTLILDVTWFWLLGEHWLVQN